MEYDPIPLKPHRTVTSPRLKDMETYSDMKKDDTSHTFPFSEFAKLQLVAVLLVKCK